MKLGGDGNQISQEGPENEAGAYGMERHYG